MFRFLHAHPRIYGIATVLLLLAAWQTSPEWGSIGRQFIPPASLVLARFFTQWGESEFYRHLDATLLRVGGGFFLAALVALPLGLVLGYWERARRMMTLTIDVIRPIPATAFVPIAILGFGIGNGMHIFVIFIAAIIPILLATIDGTRSVDPILVSTARTLGRNTAQIFRTVLLPAALPHIMTGLRIGITLALVVGISSEMVLSSEGLGWRVLYAERTLKLPELYAGILTIAAVGYVLNRLFIAAEGFVIGWHRRATMKNWG